MSMSLVAANAWTPRFDRVYVGATAPEASQRSESRGRVERNDDDDNARRMRRDDDGPGRRNPLVGALMQALKGLMADTGNAAPAPSAAAPSTGAAATANTPAATGTSATNALATPTSTTTGGSGAQDIGELKEAAVAFAHELFSALRANGNDETGRSRHHHHHHHHGHGRGHGRDGGYGNLAQGLRDLARSIDLPKSGTAATPPTTSTAPAPAPVSAPAVPPATTPVVAAPPPSAPVAAPVTAPPSTPSSEAAPIASLLPVLAAAPAGASVEININIQIKFNTPAGTATPATPAAAPPPQPESPLLAAFKRLMEQLNPTATPGSATGAKASEADSPEAKLKAFLLGIANALSGGQAGGASTNSPAPVGGLISVAA